MPRANTFFIGYPPPPWKPPGNDAEKPKAVEKLDNPHVKGWMSKHRLLRYLTGLHEIGISEAFKHEGPAAADAAADGKRPAIPPCCSRLNRQAFTDLVMTLPDPDRHGTNGTPTGRCSRAFRCFLRNVLYTLGNVSDAAGEETVQPGQVKTLRPDVTRRRDHA